MKQRNVERRRRSKREKSTLEIIDELLSKRLSFVAGSSPGQMTALEAIVLQLLNKSIAGDKRAAAVLLQYKQCDPELIKPKVTVVGGLPSFRERLRRAKNERL